MRPMAFTSENPPPLPARRIHSIASTTEVNDDMASQSITKEREDIIGVDHAEDELPEQRLRELYDDEEIDRFLNLFSACVTEVRLPASSGKSEETIHESSGKEAYIFEDDTVPVEEGDWVPVVGSSDALPSDNVSPPPSAERCLSEEIALRYLVPILPPAPLPPPAFSLGRLRLTTQRLYLAIEPAYKPFFIHMSKLAMWEDKRQSSIYCIVFWILWYHNLLLPAFFLRILHSLVRRKVLPYPTVAELREHRREIRRAKEFGDEIQARLSVSSAFGIKEMWRLFRIFNKSGQTKAMNLAKIKGKRTETMQKKEEKSVNITEENVEGATVLDDIKESREEKDVKRTILHSLSEISDLHERIKNIFIWRRPASSRMYGAVIFLLFLVTLLFPARYLAKFSYFICGIFFWHITPIIVALPPADRARLPAAFGDAPTDADYAMELISRRVAAGLPVKPMSSKTSNKRNSTSDGEIGLRDEGNAVGRDQSIDWKKWGARAAIGKEWAGDGKRIVTGGQWPSQHTRGGTQPETNVESHTFPAQHNAAPGLLNLTPTMLSFTPMMSMTAKIIIPLQDLRGVKKTGLFKGLSIRWDDTSQDGSRVENEEKFRWVGSRDELFARLLGADGRRWMRA